MDETLNEIQSKTCPSDCTRKVVDSNNNVKETINYYPFGSEMRIQDPALIQQTDNNWHPFRFTGKELDKQNGLNMYDFGARLFDVAGVPMWTSVDPLAEKYYYISPYAYCAGDPVNKFDPDGRAINWLVGSLVGAGVELTTQLIERYDTDMSVMDNFLENVNWTNVTIAAGEGALTSGVSTFKGLGAKVAVSAVTSATKEVSDQVKDGTNSYKEINFLNVGKKAVDGAAITFGVGKYTKYKIDKKYENVKATPKNAIKHQRAGQKRYSKSAQRRANQRLRKQKEDEAEKTDNSWRAVANFINSFIAHIQNDSK